LFADILFQSGDLSFPRGSWPWTLTEQAGLWLAGERDHASTEISRLLNSPTTGPLCCLGVSFCLKYSGNSDEAATYAQMGLRELSKDKFRYDVQSFLDKEHLAGQVLHCVIEGYRTMSPDEIQKNAESLEGPWRDCILACNRVFAANPEKDADEILPELLDACWDAGVNTIVERELKSLSEPPPLFFQIPSVP